MVVRYYAAYLPVPDDHCAHDGIADAVTDAGIQLGAAGELVRVNVSGSKPVTKIMCRRCGRVGGALPRRARVGNEQLPDAAALPDRDDRRPPRTRGIATDYGGSHFRSRLEARWARFFDLVGWRWTYEPVDAEGWIPDFLLHGPAPVLVEVGPCYVLSDFSKKAAKALAEARRDPTTPTLILGIAPNALYGVQHWRDVCGYLTSDGIAPNTGLALWARCRECGAPGFYHDAGPFTMRPCGHEAAGEYTENEYAPLWREAGNRTQWSPAA